MKTSTCLSICLTVFLSSVTVLNAQTTVEQLLRSIETNNSTLKVLREQTNADKLENRTGLTLPNPEVSVEYLWGKPAEIGNQFDYSITQSFDFPTAYAHRSQASKMKNTQVDIAYQREKNAILIEVLTIYANWKHNTAVKEQSEKRLQHAQDLFDAYQKLLDNGETTILEYNKARLNLLSTQKTTTLNEADVEMLTAELQRLNGGLPLEFSLGNEPAATLPFDFEDWFENLKENSTVFALLRQDVALSQRKEKLRLAENLPKLTVGYYSEHILSERLRGVQAGISIPLWEGKNTIKQQRARTNALIARYEDTELQLKNSLKSQYNKALKLQKLLDEYKTMIDVSNDEVLLKKSLNRGQISLITYLQELEAYYDIQDEYMNTRLEYELIVLGIISYE